MTTYENVHAGDIVLGYDGELWGVASIEHEPVLTVELVKGPTRVVGRPPAGTPVTVVQAADVSGERRAVDELLAGGLNVELISERWESGS